MYDGKNHEKPKYTKQETSKDKVRHINDKFFGKVQNKTEFRGETGWMGNCTTCPPASYTPGIDNRSRQGFTKGSPKEIPKTTQRYFNFECLNSTLDK